MKLNTYFLILFGSIFFAVFNASSQVTYTLNGASGNNDNGNLKVSYACGTIISPFRIILIAEQYSNNPSYIKFYIAKSTSSICTYGGNSNFSGGTWELYINGEKHGSTQNVGSSSSTSGPIYVTFNHSSGVKNVTASYKLNPNSDPRGTPAISMTAVQACNSTPTSGSTSNVTSNSFRANWSSVSGATQYEINYAKNNNNYSNSQIFTTSTNTNISGLEASTTYKFQVRAKCSNGIWGPWSPTLATATTQSPPQPGVTVADPPSGTWGFGQSRTISWSASNGGCGPYNVELSTNNGSSWIVIGSHINGTSFSWSVGKDYLNYPIPNMLYNNLRLKVYCVSNTSINDQSASFTLANPSISVTTPPALTTGQNYGILWSINNASCTTYHVELVTNNGTPKVLKGHYMDGNSYNWTVPDDENGNDIIEAIGSSQNRIKVYCTNYNQINGLSNNFSIAAPSCNLSLPGANSGSASNTTSMGFTAQWPTVSNATEYQINVVEHSNTTYTNPLTLSSTTNSVAVSGLNPSTQYRFQIRAKCANGIWTAWSPTLATPTTTGTITLSNITAPVTWHCNKTINWTSVPGVGNLTIELGNTNTGFVGVIASNIPNTGSFNWIVGKRIVNGNTLDIENFDFSQTYYLKIYPHNTIGQGTTGNGFTIPQPSISVSSPAENSNFLVGQTITMNYATQNLCGPMTVELTNAAGVTIQPMPNGQDIANVSPYSYTVTTTFPATGTYKLKIYPTVSGGPSPAVAFSPTFTVTATDPNCPTCFTNITASAFTQTGQEGYCAAQYLCSKGIIQNAQTNPTNQILRLDVAKIALLSTLSDANITTFKNGGLSFPADYYPTHFVDLYQSGSYSRYAKILSYFQGSDNTTPFDRNLSNETPRSHFDPTGTISRIDLLKVFLEAWDIDETTASSVALHFNDISDLSSGQLNYLKKAVQLNLVVNGTPSNPIAFRPVDKPGVNGTATREEAFLILYRLRALSGVAMPDLTNNSKYFQPVNQTIGNLSIYKGLSQGNFSHYESTDFGISDVGFSLSFAHTYHSFLTLLPDEWKTVSPLSSGWTHPYNVYMFNTVQIYDENGNIAGKPLLMAAWADGTFDVYDNTNVNTPTAISAGTSYNQITRVNSTTYTIKTPSQYTYTFVQQGSEAGIYRLTSIKDRYNNTLTLSYKAGTVVPFSPVKQVLDYVQPPSGRRITFTYDTKNRITQVVFPGSTSNSPRSIFFSYTGNNLRQFTNAKGKTTLYTYGIQSEQFLLKQIAYPKGNKIENIYDPNGRVEWTQAKNAQNVVTAKTEISYGVFNSQGQYTNTSTIDCNCPNSQTTETFNANGSVIAFQNSVVKVQSPVSSLHPTLPGSVTQSALNGGLAQTYTPNYDNRGNILSITRPDGKTESFTYDTYNNRKTHTDAKGITTTYNWSTDGRYLKSVSRPTGTGGNVVQMFVYSPNGLLSSSTINENIVTNYGYNSYGNLNSVQLPALSISSSAIYDYASRMTSATDPRGKTTTFIYDNNDLLTRETDALGRQTNYAYDDNDNLTTITNAKGEITTLGYDDFDRLTSETFAGKTKTYIYDNARNRIAEFRKAGYVNDNTKRFTYTYDTHNRLKSNGYIQDMQYDDLNRLRSIRGGSVSNHELSLFSYDVLNRMTSYKDHWNNTVGYDYDENGNIIRIDYPNNNKVHKTYDNLNRLRTVSWNATVVATYNYNGTRLDNVVYGNGVKTQYTYDNVGRPTGISTRTNNGSGSTIYSANFVLDKLGNHLEENEVQPFAAPTISNSNITYNYNSGNRLSTVNKQIGNSTTIISISHDNDGNIISKGALYNMAYDLEDNLTSYEDGSLDMSFEYDAFGHRRKAIRNGTETRYILDINDGLGSVLAETNASGTVQNYYIHGLGLVARVKADGTLHYYHGDFRGSTIAMTNAGQAITHKYQYDEFGNLTNSQEVDANPFRYVGAYGIMYETPDLAYMRARYYDPTTGRFNSEDPIWSTNLYPYAGNNGVMNIDFNGLMPKNLSSIYYSGYSIGNINTKNAKTAYFFDIPIVVPRSVSLKSNILEMQSLTLSMKFDEKILTMYYMFRNKAQYDYKQWDRMYENWGNFHFGAIGASIGLGLHTLLGFAGLANVRADPSRIITNPEIFFTYGDDPNDQYYIALGYYYYHTYKNVYAR